MSPWVWMAFTLAWGLLVAVGAVLLATEGSLRDWLAVFRGERTRPTFRKLAELERQDAHTKREWPRDVDKLERTRAELTRLKNAAQALADACERVATNEDHEVSRLMRATGVTEARAELLAAVKAASVWAAPYWLAAAVLAGEGGHDR